MDYIHMQMCRNLHKIISHRSTRITFKTCICSRILICPHLSCLDHQKTLSLRHSKNSNLNDQQWKSSLYNYRKSQSLLHLKKRSLLHHKTWSLHHSLTRRLQHHKNHSLLRLNKRSLLQHKTWSMLHSLTRCLVRSLTSSLNPPLARCPLHPLTSSLNPPLARCPLRSLTSSLLQSQKNRSLLRTLSHQQFNHPLARIQYRRLARSLLIPCLCLQWARRKPLARLWALTMQSSPCNQLTRLN